VVLGRDFRLRAFHNVCRHRAYTVVRKSCGTSTVFSCKYHGWQYADTGKLLKAPKFDANPGFVMEDNSLFEISLVTTREGLVFVNFDAGTNRSVREEVKSQVDLAGSEWAQGTDVLCETNWKELGECFAVSRYRRS
jgi:phenylpropionate dioxygenase-like ring-hydroxylating dioxygenase large terminal subunit